MTNEAKMQALINLLSAKGYRPEEWAVADVATNDFAFTIVASDRRLFQTYVSDTKTGIPICSKDSDGDLIDERVQKQIAELNVHNSVTDNEYTDYRGVLDIGNYDGIPFSFNHIILEFVAADIVNDIGATPLDTELSRLHNQYGHIGAHYIRLNQPQSYDNFCYPPYYSELVGCVDPGWLIYTQLVGGGYETRVITPDGPVAGLYDTEAPVYDFVQQSVEDDEYIRDIIDTGTGMVVSDTAALSYTQTSLSDPGNDIAVFYTFKTDWEADQTDVRLIAMSEDANSVFLSTSYDSVADTFVFEVELTGVTFTTRSMKLLQDSYHVIGFITDIQGSNKNVYFFIDGHLVEVLTSTDAVSCGISSVQVAPTVTVTIGEIITYDLGTTKAATWLEDKHLQQISNYLCNLYSVVV